MKDLIIPKALVSAAKTFRKNPKMVGEVLIALVTEGVTSKMSDVQKYILQASRDELEGIQARRKAAAERQRKHRGVAK